MEPQADINTTGLLAQKENEFMKMILSFSAKHRTYQIFRDFIALSARMISNRLVRFKQEYEDEFLRIEKGYSKEEMTKFAQLFALVHDLLGLGTYTDFLGNCFMRLELGNERTGQFFTPYHVCQLMARLTVGDDFTAVLSKSPQKIIAVSDPCCGAGATVIAYAEMMAESNIDVSKHLYVEGIDVDPLVAEMCYVQCSLLGIPAHIRVGNTLTLDISRTYATPALLKHNWPVRLHEHFREGMQADQSSDLETSVQQPILIPSVSRVLAKADQIALF